MRTILSRSILALFVIALATLATSSAKADTTLNVPFSFTVAGKTLPAGLYTLKHDTTGNFVTLKNADSSQSLTWVLSAGAPDRDKNKAAMRFDSFGETHVLRSIQIGPMMTRRLDKTSEAAEGETARPLRGR